MDAVLGDAVERGGAAGDIDLAVGNGGSSGAALRWHRRELLPLILGGVVFPGVVDRTPGRRSLLRQDEAAEGVDLVVEAGEGDVVGIEPHRLLLRPLIAGRIVLPHQRARPKAWTE